MPKHLEGPFEGANSEPSPLLAQYLAEHAQVPATVLELPHVPRLIGGPKSTKFILQEPEATPDTPPNPDATIDLSQTVIPSADGADFFAQAEAQAERQYPDALFETQQLLADQSADREVRTLFVPDSTNGSARRYRTRVQRLAQDIGMRVVMPWHAHEDGMTYSGWNTYDPPTARSVEAYWETFESRPEFYNVHYQWDDHLQDDRELRASTMARVEQIVANGLPDGFSGHLRLPHSLESLFGSYQLDAGRFLSGLLNRPHDATVEYDQMLAHAIVYRMPQFLDVVMAQQPSAEQRMTLDIIEQRLASFLDGALADRPTPLKNSRDFLISETGDMLYRFGDPQKHHDLLRRHVLGVFVAAGSVITDSGFERHYLRYRKLFGDLEEISQKITIQRD